MTAPAEAPPDTTPETGAEGLARTLPSGVVKTAAVTIVPWTIGSLLSPFGEPHPLLLALPLLALGLVIAAARAPVAVRRPSVPWLFAGTLLLTSLTRFVIVPIAGEIFTGGEDLDAHGRGIEGVMFFLAMTKLVFYAACLALVIWCGVGLWRRRLPRAG